MEGHQVARGGKGPGLYHNALQREVDLYRPCEMPYQFAFIKTGLDPNVSHTIRIVVTGLKNAKSGGTAVGHMAFEHAAQSYKASAGFCSVAGKNNWLHQQYDVSIYSDLFFFAPDEKQFYGDWIGKGNTKVGNNAQTPDTTEAVRKWVAPHDGTIRVVGAPSLDKASPEGLRADHD